MLMSLCRQMELKGFWSYRCFLRRAWDCELDQFLKNIENEN